MTRREWIGRFGAAGAAFRGVAAGQGVGGDWRQMEYSARSNRPFVFSGERLELDVTFRNTGDAPFPVPGSGDPSPFEFVLTPEDPPGKTYVFSARQKQTSIVNSPVLPETVRNPRPLLPGRKINRPEELASYSSEPLASGRYRLGLSVRDSAGKREVAETPVTVAAPWPSILAAESCPMSRTRLSAYAAPAGTPGPQDPAPDRWALLLRQSRIGTPRHSPAVRAVEKDGAAASSVAVAIDAVPLKPQPRWFAWIDSEGLWLRSIWDLERPVVHGPVGLEGLTGARLVSPGFTVAARQCFFLVLGRKAGAGVIRRYSLIEGVVSLEWEAALEGPPPEHCVARLHEGRITLVSKESSESSLLTRNYTAAGKALGERSLKFERPIAAFALEAATSWLEELKSGDGPLHVLLQPDLKSEMEYRRLVPEMDGELERFTFLSPAIRTSEYTICTGPLLGVVAKAGQQLLFLKSRVRTWQAFAERTAIVSHMQLFTVDGHEYYAEWFDPKLGCRQVRLTGH